MFGAAVTAGVRRNHVTTTPSPKRITLLAIHKLQVLPNPEGTEEDAPDSTKSYFLCTEQQ